MKSTMASASVQPQSGSLDVLLFVRTITASRRKPKRREKEMTNDGRVVCLPLSSTSRRDAERVSTSPLCRWDWQTTQQTTCSLTLINEHTHTHTCSHAVYMWWMFGLSVMPLSVVNKVCLFIKGTFNLSIQISQL